MKHYCACLIVAFAGLVAVSGSLAGLSRQIAAKSGAPVVRRGRTTRPYPAALSPSAAALRRARWWRLRAQEQVARQREAIESWDPEVREPTGRREWEDWRAQMAQDQGGYLGRAEAAAEQAVELAGSPAETYRATDTLALIECNRGNYEGELRAARRLRALDPRNELSLYWLRHAARAHRLRGAE